MNNRLAITTLAFLALLASACAAGSEERERATPSISPAVAAATTTRAVPASPTPTGLAFAQVTRVVDGDTIDVLLDGREQRLRYIGMNTPETVDPRRPVECFGHEASERNRQLVEGKTVGLERDVSETDRYGRLLRYVWVEGAMVNATLVAEGYATAATFPPDVKYADTFAALEAEARAAGRGLWGEACQTPPPPAPAAGTCEYSGTAEPVIKGNISLQTGEKIYHVPGGYYYDDTVISEAKGERWFCTEAEAVAAGWRRSLR